MFINKSAAQRILNCKFHGIKIRVVKIWRINAHQICIRYSARNSKNVVQSYNAIVKAELFWLDAVNLRETSAKDSREFHSEEHNEIQVKFDLSDTWHTVNLTRLECSCDDFKNQLEYGNGFTPGYSLCKHYIAVRNLLGFTSINDLIKSRNLPVSA
jgi:hypothetical protein